MRLSSEAIVVITHNAVDGGSVGAVAWNHVKQFSKTFDVFVITQDMPNTQNPKIHPLIVNPKKWNFLGRFCHVPNELSFFRAARQALEGLPEQVNLKAVWCHSHGAMALAAGPVARKSSFLKVMTTHGDIFERPSGTYDRLLTLFYKSVTPRAHAACDIVHTLSPFMKELALHQGVDEGAVVTIPNGIDPEEIGLGLLQGEPAVEACDAGDRLKVLYVGSLLPIKGVRHLLRALALAKQRTGPRIALQCIGDGPEHAALLRLTGALGLEDCVTFLGRVPKQDLAAHYMNADVLCVPSDSDPLPTVVLEAFAAGLPVIGANTGGIPFMVTPERGWVFAPGNVEELTAKLVSVASDRPQLAEHRTACRAAAQSEFNWDNIGNALLQVIEEATPFQRGH